MRMRNSRTGTNNKPRRLSTLQRRLLLDTLREAKGDLDARELYQRVIEKNPHISQSTVYRNLQLFKKLGLVDERRLDEMHCYYEIKASTEHYHMVCVTCGRVLEFESPLVNQLIAGVGRNSDFVVARAVLYLEGHCHNCESQEKTH